MGRQDHHVSWIVLCVLHDSLCFQPDWLFLHQRSGSCSCYQFLICFGFVDCCDGVLESDTWQMQHHFRVHRTVHSLLFAHQFILLWSFLYGHLEHRFCSSFASLLDFRCSSVAAERVSRVDSWSGKNRRTRLMQLYPTLRMIGDIAGIGGYFFPTNERSMGSVCCGYHVRLQVLLTTCFQ